MLQKKRKYGFENLEKTFRQTKQLAEQLFASVYEKKCKFILFT